MRHWIATMAIIDGYEKATVVQMDHVRYCLPADEAGTSTRCVFAEDETLVILIPFATMQAALLAGSMP